MTVRKYELQMPVELVLPENKKKCIFLVGNNHCFLGAFSVIKLGKLQHGYRRKYMVKILKGFKEQKGHAEKLRRPLKDVRLPHPAKFQVLMGWKSVPYKYSKVSPINWSTTFHILKVSIFHLPLYFRKGNCFLAYHPGQITKPLQQ